MSNSTRFVAICASLFGLFVTQTVLAESMTKTSTSEGGDYSYRFSDEDLLGGTLNNVGDMYRSRPKVARVMLLRPRTSLVQEILNSVEDL
jgi:hypothetical protein